MKKKLLFSFLIVVLLVTGRGIQQACETDLVSSTMDWRPQDYEDSQGITGVYYDENLGCLVLECDLKGGDPYISNGEIVLDLRYVPCLEANVPVDMTNQLITAKIDIPAGFVSSSPPYNGCQVFVKDTEWRSQYGTWENCDSSRIFTLELQPSTETPDSGYTEPGFDPKNIRVIGIKIGINANSTHQFSGTIKINKIEVTPPLPFTSPPQLPAGQPMPFVKGDSEVEIQPDGFYIDNKKWFIAGGNWRLIEYRQNFGATAWFPKGNGVSMHPGFVETRLGWFRQAGITLVRVSLLDDGAAVLDRDGNVVGFDDIFRDDVTTFLTLAKDHDMKVEFALVDFLITGKEEECEGVWLRGRREVIENPQVRSGFIQNFLEPFLTFIQGLDLELRSVIFGFDIINEPEWIIAKADGGAWEDVTDENRAETPVAIDQFRNFITECTGKIRELVPGKFVSVGVSCEHIGLVENLGPDYTAMHYYPWMGNLEVNLAYAPGNIPWNLEEFPGKGDIYSYFETVFENGGAGALNWNMSPGIDIQCYTFEDEEEKLQEIRRFVDDLAPLVPAISLNRAELSFAADTSGSVTGSQTFLIDNSGTGILNWSVDDDAAWLGSSPESGRGAGTVTVSVDPTGLAVGSYTGTITVSDPNAVNSPQRINVTLTVHSPGTTDLPFGDFATPEAGSTVSSSVAVTGWALDDIGVESVKIYSGQTYIGDALFVEGARTDIEQAYPGYPQNHKAGWGYMLLTNFLPDGGNGTYTLNAAATDMEGHRVILGSKTVTVDNANAVKPFGAIDTPTQGGSASGSNFANQGWALTPGPNKIPVDGSTIKLYIDGVLLNNAAVYNLYRPDIAGYFPGYANSDGAGIKFTIDTTAYSSGIHTIYWIAADDAGNADGIGSRYFSIQNSGSAANCKFKNSGHRQPETMRLLNILPKIPVDFSEPVGVIKGYGNDAEPKLVYPGNNGIVTIETGELERLELRLSPGAAGWLGFQVVGRRLMSLPIGSTMDKKRGIFYWQPSVGFLGDFQFVFIRMHPSGETEKKQVMVRILPGKGEVWRLSPYFKKEAK